jgi:hypothetical protein
MAIQSLFGPSPAQVMEQRRKEAEQEILQQGKEFGVFAPLYQAGLRFGEQSRQAMQGMFPGQQDAALQEATAVQSVLAKYADQDQSNPAILSQIGRELLPIAPNAGFKALEMASKLQKENKLTTVAPGASVIDASGNVVFTAPDREKEGAPTTAAERDYLVSLQSKYPDTTEGRAAAANEFAEWKSSFRQREQAAGVSQTPTEKALTPIVAKTRGDILNAALNSQKTLQTANAMDSLLNTAFTGVGSGGKLTLGQVASAFGVQVQGVTETEQLNSLLAALTQGQAKNLPGALSDKDVQFLKDAIGKGSYTVDTLRAVVKRIRTEALTAEIENAEIQAVTNAGGDLNKFDFVANRKKANTLAQQQLKEQEDKIKRLQQLRQKRGF